MGRWGASQEFQSHARLQRGWAQALLCAGHQGCKRAALALPPAPPLRLGPRPQLASPPGCSSKVWEGQSGAA